MSKIKIDPKVNVTDVAPIWGVYPGDCMLPGLYPVGSLIRHQGCVYTVIRHQGSSTVLDRPLEYAHAGVSK